MTKSEWVEVCGAALKAEGIEHFHPLEVCDAGRVCAASSSFPAQRLKVPPVHLIPTAILLCRVLCDLRAARRPMPVRVNSWYRDSLYNHAIGGVTGSMHLTCGAADIIKPGFTPDEVADMLEDHPDAKLLGIGRYKSFTHLDIRGMIARPSPARW